MDPDKPYIQLKVDPNKPYFQLRLDPDKAQAGLSDLPVLEQAIEDGDAFFDNGDFATASKFEIDGCKTNR